MLQLHSRFCGGYGRLCWKAVHPGNDYWVGSISLPLPRTQREREREMCLHTAVRLTSAGMVCVCVVLTLGPVMIGQRADAIGHVYCLLFKGIPISCPQSGTSSWGPHIQKETKHDNTQDTNRNSVNNDNLKAVNHNKHHQKIEKSYRIHGYCLYS